MIGCVEEVKSVCRRSRSDEADFEMEIKARVRAGVGGWGGRAQRWESSLLEEIFNAVILIHFQCYVPLLFQPGTSEVKCSETWFPKGSFSCWSYLRIESPCVGLNKIHGFMDLCSQLQTSNSPLSWTACKVWVISLKPREGTGTDVNFRSDFCK